MESRVDPPPTDTDTPDNAPESEEKQSGRDKRSKKEELFLSEDQYKDIQTKRRSDFKLQVHCASVLGLWLGVAFYTIAIFTWLYHLLAPMGYHFMPMANVGTLQNLLFGTIVGGLISQLARRIFSD